ncbi:MAG TPA: hypothetical protein VF704_11295 [Allosphingosinicella sp.]|jgi:hypothetical protein
MIAKGFKPVAWVAAIGTAALGCYMLSLQVAAERADLATLERQIMSTRQDIRALQTELGTRGRLSQLEQWNAEVLALSAPVAGQFLESNLSLARFDTRQRTVADQQEVRLASAPTAPAPPVQAPLHMASAEAPAAPPSAPAAAQPLVRRASFQTPPARPAAAVRPGVVRPALVQARSAGLLDAGTLDQLDDAARSERGTEDGN